MKEDEKQVEEGSPNFLGYYSAIIDGTLVSLMNASTPGAREYDVYANSTDINRYDVLDLLEKEKIDTDNSEVENIIQKQMGEGKPFGLYLRNFVLGARNRPSGRKVFGIPQIATIISAQDQNMQTLLKTAFPDITFVAISNPAYNTTIIPQLILSDDQWMNAADNLIKHAGFIVMFFLSATHGVMDEINMLRTAGVQKRTIIIVASDDPRDSDLHKSMLALLGELPETTTDKATTDPATLISLLPDFPYIIHPETNEGNTEFINSMQEIIKTAEQNVNTEKFMVPPRPMPDAHLLHLAKNGALNEFDNGVRFFNAHEGKPAEDAFIRSIVFNYWAWDRLGRSVAFMHLGHTRRYLLNDSNRAVDCYFKSLDTLVSILSFSPTAREYYKIMALGLSEYLKSIGDTALAQSVIDKYV